MVRVAVVGCAHGMLDDIFATVRFINEMDTSRPIELLLCCGDFECMRNSRDLATLACPPKYRAMHSFHEYYKRDKTAPVLTIFVGGNHEASSYLSELHYGGWVAPNIFYLGAAGVINVAGLRIAGLSGIYKHQDYTAGRFERAPFDNSTMRSVYHVRELEVFQLSHIQRLDTTPISAFLSHDWPRGIEQFGDVRALVRRKPFFQQEIQSNTLGSPAGEYLLFQLQPQHWFAAHLHVKFAALVRHAPAVVSTVVSKVATSGSTADAVPGADAAAAVESTSDDTVAASTSTNTPPAPTAAPVERVTKFLALDKCLPRREFLQVIDIPGTDPNSGTKHPATFDTSRTSPLKVLLDFEWLAVLRATHHLASANKHAPRVPLDELRIEPDDVAWVQARYQAFVAEKALTCDVVAGEWLSDFEVTAPAFGADERAWDGRGFSGNPQTDLLLELLKLPHVVTAPYVGGSTSGTSSAGVVADPNAIDLDDDDDDDTDNVGVDAGNASTGVMGEPPIDTVMCDTTNQQPTPSDDGAQPVAVAVAVAVAPSESTSTVDDPNALDIDL